MHSACRYTKWWHTRRGIGFGKPSDGHHVMTGGRSELMNCPNTLGPPFLLDKVDTAFNVVLCTPTTVGHGIVDRVHILFFSRRLTLGEVERSSRMAPPAV